MYLQHLKELTLHLQVLKNNSLTGFKEKQHVGYKRHAVFFINIKA
jgi:hypothetical protein